MDERRYRSTALRRGTRLLERFDLEVLLAERELSETHRARDTTTGAPAVVRVLRVRGASSWQAAKLFEREAEALQRIIHDAIPRPLAYGEMELGGALHCILAKEYVPGETLAERLLRTTLPLEEVARLGAQVAELLVFLHTQSPPMIHRDLKPSNVVVRPDGRVSLIDFGAVTHPAMFNGEGGSTIVGTFGFMAPEQALGEAGPSSDLYALGATLLAMVTRKEPSSLPRDGGRVPVAELLGDSSLARLIGELLEPDPRLRPSDAAEVAERLWRIARGEEAPLGPGDGDLATAVRWRGVLRAWDDPDVHEDFLRWCESLGQLPAAASRYQAALRERRGDHQAQAMLARLDEDARHVLAAAQARAVSARRGGDIFSMGSVTVMLMALWLLWVIFS